MKKTLLAVSTSLLLATAAYAQQQNADEKDVQLGDVLGILIGAYQGAADAAEKSGHSFLEEKLSPEEVARLQRGLNYLQSELQSLVDKDGKLDTARAAELLNALQQLQGDTRFDFVKAEQALQRVERGDLTLEGALNLLTNPESVALSEEVARLKRLAAEQIGASSDEGALVDLLKIVYADRKLGSVNAEREIRAHALVAEALQQGGMSEAHYGEIRTLLDAIGSPFKADYRAWNKARDNIIRRELKREEMTDVISLLQNKELTPEQREQILRALRQ